jgi:glycosyltransferase involved in cell wall biosynthesis
MRILFLDQTGKLGGAELSLLDVVKPYGNDCLVCLFSDGILRQLLEEASIPVRVLNDTLLRVTKNSNLFQNLSSTGSLISLVSQVAKLARHYDCIYANTQKALVVGALASFLSRRPLIYHLRDILSADHFSFTNRKVAVTLANCFASQVITNSKATQAAFIKAGGRADLTKVVYNGFQPEQYQVSNTYINQVRKEFGLEGQFVVGHFSRLSPWKGQHVLLDALVDCPSTVVAIFVGDALFGEQEYAEALHQRVIDLGLQERVRFLGFRSDVVRLMSACDLIAHTSTAPEPFGRVIVEAMLCGRPVVASNAGGATELIQSNKTGWLFRPGDAKQLAEIITFAQQNLVKRQALADAGKMQAALQFHLTNTNQRLAQLLNHVILQS